jgi:hypothetical protein
MTMLPPSVGPRARDEELMMARVARSIQDRFPEVSAEEIDARIEGARRWYANAPVREYVALMIEREIVVELEQRAAS